jgi:hypothetical protein
MPYLGRAPTGTGSVTEIDGDLKITGQLTANDTLFKMIMDTAANLGDNILIEDGGTDGSGTNAGDDICLEKDMQSVGATEIISISGVAGATAAGWEFLSKITCSTSSTIDVTSLITAGYDYNIIAYGIDLSADSYLRCTFSSDNNSSQITSAYYSGGELPGAGWNTANVAFGSLMHTGTAMDEAHGEVFFDMILYNPMDSDNQTTIQAKVGDSNTSNQLKINLAFTEQRSDVAVNAIRIFPSSGNFNTGEVFIYRRPNA